MTGRLTVRACSSLRGRIAVPGDKSIAHRTLLLGALADGTTHARGFPPSGDCASTLACVRALGARVEVTDEGVSIIHGQGLHGLRAPEAPLDCGRSGTAMRLLAGILAGQRFDSVLTGDPQLLRRPMQRVIEPLRRMGADIEGVDGHGPLTIRGAPLVGRDHGLEVASAQVKSALLLAGLYADGPTTVRQPGPARDHTELMLEGMGANLKTDGLVVTLWPGSALAPLSHNAPPEEGRAYFTLPGDLSSAAFPLCAATLVPGSGVTVTGVGLNRSRTGLLDVLGSMGARIELSNHRREGLEPVADVTARWSELHGVAVSGDTVVRMIDEFPILAVVATQACGITHVRDASELRVKESDRIATMVAQLRTLGAQIEGRPDGFVVEGPTPLRAAAVESGGDHRVAMALVVAGLIAKGETVVREASTCIGDSFPGFVTLMEELGAGISSKEEEAS